MADIYFRPDGQNRFQIRSAANGTLPSAWLDQELNRIYTYLNSIEAGGSSTAGSEWSQIDAEFIRTSTTSFSVEGDYTGVFEVLRAIQFTDDADVKYNTNIKTASYVGGTNTTTVTVYDSVVPATIQAIAVGLIGSEAQPIPSVTYTTRTSSPYTVSAKDQIIFADDSTIGSLSLTYDDDQINGDGYYALRVYLPVAGDMPGKLLCVKKIGGSYRTIVSAPFTHTTETVTEGTKHINTYTFQIYGDSSAKNRVTLKGIGDCYWFVSNGNRWYEVTPEASETVKGIVRFATDNEMTLTAQQIADGETLSKNLAVNPYQADKEYVRTDASNIRFASNYIYKSPNGVAALVNNNIVVYNGLGLNFPNGRDANGVLQSTKHELAQNYTFNPVEVTEKKKLLFVQYDSSTDSFSLQPVLAQNYYMGYTIPTVSNTSTGDVVLWFDLSTNTMKESTDNGTNWTTFAGCGPICEFWGNGTYITNIQAWSAVGFLTREEYENFLKPSGIKATSGSFKIGNGLKINFGYFWCNRDSSAYVSFPTPFENATTYQVVVCYATAPNVAGNKRETGWASNLTTTGFIYDSNNESSAADYRYIAIGY